MARSKARKSAKTKRSKNAVEEIKKQESEPIEDQLEDEVVQENMNSEKTKSEDIKEEEEVAQEQEQAEEQAEEEEGYNEEDDEDYDPESKAVTAEGDEEDEEDEEDKTTVPDYSGIESSVSQIRTRSQKLVSSSKKRATHIGSFETDERGLVKEVGTSLDLDAIFRDMKNGTDAVQEWKASANNQIDSQTEEKSDKPESTNDGILAPKKIKIETSYAFAGKLVTETKYVDEDSAEAKAYLNTTASITVNPKQNKKNRSFVNVIRKVVKSEEEKELRIKLKRPSLIDNFMESYGTKKQKLTTLEKSRLDWASFVDKRKIGEELKIHNKAGYLDTQDFLGRVEARRDEHYLKAKEDDRQRQFLLNAQANN
ncbi:bucentaur or craniofacial development-domain-containing protein [Scheffersomyces amazonensis]|uniref:bucentaur or craniofacial development-domain-containing protein n=1 Tax=Scheffersomyces amazonensis TaxID=1078765 RepID=UPI00315D4D3A